MHSNFARERRNWTRGEGDVWLPVPCIRLAVRGKYKAVLFGTATFFYTDVIAISPECNFEVYKNFYEIRAYTKVFGRLLREKSHVRAFYEILPEIFRMPRIIYSQKHSCKPASLSVTGRCEESRMYWWIHTVWNNAIDRSSFDFSFSPTMNFSFSFGIV